MDTKGALNLSSRERIDEFARHDIGKRISCGFGVVLGMRAVEVAKNTSNLIEGTVQKITTGNALVSGTSETFNVASQSTVRIGAIIAETAGAASQQANAITQVTKAIHEIDTITQSNAAAASKPEEISPWARTFKGRTGAVRQKKLAIFIDVCTVWKHTMAYPHNFLWVISAVTRGHLFFSFFKECTYDCWS